MDLRIGVLSHTVLSHTYQEHKQKHERDNYNNDMVLDENDELSD